MMLNDIYRHVRTNGTLAQTAQTKWGRDTWVLDDVRVGLEDEGYTIRVLTDELNASSTCGRAVTFARGDVETLRALHTKLGLGGFTSSLTA